MYVHRSLTGYCFFMARLVAQNGLHRIVDVCVNSDASQYCFGDEQDATYMLNLVLDLVLLQIPRD